ncbi:MAG: HU family DNA-binding protein, partial [Saprospiraceae bacterium]
AVDSVLESIEKSLKKGDRVTLVGFGTFAVSVRKAREGRNPATGKTIKIPKKKVVRFKAGKGLSEKLN